MDIILDRYLFVQAVRRPGPEHAPISGAAIAFVGPMEQPGREQKGPAATEQAPSDFALKVRLRLEDDLQGQLNLPRLGRGGCDLSRGGCGGF